MRSNCFIWCIYNRVRYGGKINVYWQNIVWWGPHTTWTRPDGEEWEFTLARKRPKPWWWLPILYKGVVKRVK